MARFDVHRTREGQLVVNCQSELFDHLSVRLVMPLVPRADAPPPAGRLNPAVEYDGETYLAFPQWSASVAVAELGPPLGNLGRDEFRLIGAIDFLLTGV